MELRRLPISIPPACNETIDSYVGRLAKANHLARQEFTDFIRMADRPGGKQPITLGRLSAASGYAPRVLWRALPEMRVRWEPTRFHGSPVLACSGCAARYGGHVHWFLPSYQYVCPRHQYWIGPPDSNCTGDRVSVTRLPEVAAAQHRHSILARRRGHAAAIEAFADALRIQLRWARQGVFGKPRDERLAILAAPNEPISLDEDRFWVAIYPETVDLAALLASPSWRHRLAASSNNEQTIRQFEAEAGRRVGYPDYQRFAYIDPLGRWRDKVSAA